MKKTLSLMLTAAAGWLVSLLPAAAAVGWGRWMGLAPLPASQVGTGVYGFFGGVLMAPVWRKAGIDVRRRSAVALGITWALACVAAVSLLFSTSGSSAQMIGFAFYSFSVCGAVGGMATLWAVYAATGAGGPAEPLTAITAWSLGVGAAALAASFSGTHLQRWLPSPAAWSAAVAVMAVLLGVTTAIAVAAATVRSAAAHRQAIREPVEAGDRFRPEPVLMLILCLPFYVNDAANILIRDWRWWLAIDAVAVKVLPIAVLVWCFREKGLVPASVGIVPRPARSFAALFWLALLLGVFIDQNTPVAISVPRWYPALGHIPVILDPFWRWVDLTLGLLLVGIIEEIIFRGCMLRFLSQYTRRPAVIIAVSAAAFGAIHWSAGFPAVLAASTVGAVFMALYMTSGSLPAIILAHFLINFIDFSHLLPVRLLAFI